MRFLSYSATSAQSGVSVELDERGNVTWLYTPGSEGRFPMYGESELMFLPVAEGLTVPFLPHTRHYGRWVHLNATTERKGTLTRPLSWNRTGALTHYTQPTLGLCSAANLTEYAFIPYALDLKDNPPPSQLSGASARPSPLNSSQFSGPLASLFLSVPSLSLSPKPPPAWPVGASH